MVNNTARNTKARFFGRTTGVIALAAFLVMAALPASGLGLTESPTDTPTAPEPEGSDFDLHRTHHANPDAAAALAALEGDDAPDVRDVFAVHVERVKVADPDLAEHVGPLLEQQWRNLDLVKAIQDVEAAGHEDDLARDFEIIAAATAWQATTLGVELETVAPHDHTLPSEAALALTERHGVEVPPDQHEELAALDELPETQRNTLTALINGFLALEDATHTAYQNADIEPLLERAEEFERDLDRIGELDLERLGEDDHTALVDAGVQVGLILGTRTQFLATVMDFQRAWEDHAMAATAGSKEPGIDLCPALAMDLEGTDTLYEDNCALVVDIGGDDMFLNNAGGSKLLGGPDACPIGSSSLSAAAALVNLDGTDQYISEGQCGVNGGGFLGVGFLYDNGGIDTYTARRGGTNGGGYQGVGFLYDAGGDDTYTTGIAGSNGGGLAGLGFLYDAGGNDTYTAGDQGTNGGGLQGVGFLYDAGGDDIYEAGTGGVNGGGNADISTSPISGPGIGLLLDAGGTDRYEDDDYVCDNRDTDTCTRIPKGTVGALIDTDFEVGEEVFVGGFIIGDTIPSEEVEVPPQSLEIPPVEAPPTCELDPCEEEATILPGDTITTPGVPPQNLTTPEVRIERTCAPADLFCVGPIVIEEQHLGTTPPIDEEDIDIPALIAPAVCDEVPQLCIGPIELFPGDEITTPPIQEGIPEVEARVTLDDIQGHIDPLGSPTEIGPVVITIPNPFGPDIPVELCPEGCPIPATPGDAEMETAVSVVIRVDDEEHEERVPVEL